MGRGGIVACGGGQNGRHRPRFPRPLQLHDCRRGQMASPQSPSARSKVYRKQRGTGHHGCVRDGTGQQQIQQQRHMRDDVTKTRFLPATQTPAPRCNGSEAQAAPRTATTQSSSIKLHIQTQSCVLAPQTSAASVPTRQGCGEQKPHVSPPPITKIAAISLPQNMTRFVVAGVVTQRAAAVR